MNDKHELPREGGSYVRQKDGTLKRAGGTTPVPAEADAAAKPAAKPAKKAKE